MSTAPTATSGAAAPQQFTQILRELVSRYGIDQGKKQDAGGASNGAPPLDIKELLLLLEQRISLSDQILKDCIQSHAPPPYPPLALVNKPNLSTAEAAYYLSRRPQTMRCWASKSGIGPLVPKRIGGLLAWSTAEVKALVGV